MDNAATVISVKEAKEAAGGIHGAFYTGYINKRKNVVSLFFLTSEF